MERKACMPDQSLLFLFQQPVEAVILLIFRPAACFNAMDQVIVEISRAGLFQLLIEDPVPVLQGVEKSVVQLGCQGKAIPGMAVYESGLTARWLSKP